MINVQNISSKLASLPDQALKQYAEMHKEDPYVFSLALSESNRRKQMRSQGQQAMPQPRVVDKELEEMDMRKELPENLGIARLPVDMNMASGGIVAFDDGGMTHYDKGGTIRNAGSSEDSDAFKFALNNTLKLEGGLNKNDKVGGLTKYGISQRAYPDLDIANLTLADAKDIYKKDYWNKIGGDQLAQKDPNLAALAFDTAVQHGVTGAQKMLAVSGNDTAKLLQVRSDKLRSLVEDNPEKYGKQAKGWSKRISQLAFDLVPASTAVAGEMPRPAGNVAAPEGIAALAPSEVAATAPAQPASQSASIGPATKWSDLVPSWMTPPEKPVAPKTGPSATLSGMGKALVTPEGVKRAATGLVEDSALSMAGAPADLVPTTKIPLLRGLGAGAEYLRSKFAPNAPKDVGTTEDLKRKATEAGLRPQDSTDPNMRAIQTSGEIAGSIFHPVDAVRSLTGAAAKAIRGARADLGAEKVSAGLSAIADKKDAAVAAAKEAAAAAAEKIKNIRLGSEVPPKAPVPPPMTPQGPAFPVSEEAMRLKQQAADAAAARAKPAAPEAPKGLEALAADKAAAEEAARVAARLEAEAVEARAKVGAKPTEPAVPTSVRPPRIVASPGQIVARDANKTFPDIGSEDGAEAIPSDYQPDNSRGYPAPAVDDRTKRDPANYKPEEKKQIIEAAKDAVPKSEDTDGWSKNDWLQFGLALMAGKSSNALTNVGEAGLALLSSKQARDLKNKELEMKNRELDIYKEGMTNRHATPEKIQIAERLMKEKVGLSFPDALEQATALVGGATRDEKISADKLKEFQAAKTKLYDGFKLYMGGTGPAAKAQQAEYQRKLKELYSEYKMPMEAAATAPRGSPIEVLGVRPNP